jgi:hypothetical protein
VKASGATRRVFVAVLTAAPVTALFAGSAGVLRKAARLGRPSALGTSSTRCGQCGQSGHAMLGCPSSRKVI